MTIIDLIFEAAIGILAVAFYITFGIYIGLRYKSFSNFADDVMAGILKHMQK